MKQAIVNFCKSMDTGLFLLDMPTGFGKTYSVLDFMVDNYDAPEFKDKKIFFVTTLKKMLMCGKEAKPRQRQPRLPLYRIRMEQ